MLASLSPRIWPLVLLASTSSKCEAPCRGTELARIAPAEVGDAGSARLELPPGARLRFFQDLRLTSGGIAVTVTKTGPDGKEILQPGQKPKPPPYPGKIVQLRECYRWEIDVTQAEATTHLSCNPMVRGGQCGETKEAAGLMDKFDCLVDACEVELSEGGPTAIEARFDVRYDCGYQVDVHVLKVMQNDD